ncbi:MAG: hypothetical protein ACTSU5_16085 [Promethearchaeota archaeon]
MMLIVNSSLIDNITGAIDQYVADAAILGYQVDVVNWTPAMGDNVSLKTALLNNYSAYANFKGAVLVGDLPYASYFLPKDTPNKYWYDDFFPCDLYLMDLDGVWGDLDYDGHLDNHFGGTGDTAPEIWVSRINAMTLTPYNATNLTRSYFERLHQYRLGQISRTNRGLLYIDDDWAAWGNEWKSDLLRAYSDVTMINASAATNATDYKSRLVEDYEFLWVLVHSNYTEHGFGPTPPSPPYGSEGFVYPSDIQAIDPLPFFYNLYACYASRFNETDYIAGRYLFNNHTLGIFGSTKTGGLNWGTPLYTDLGNNWTFGDAFVDWFTNSPRGVADPYASYGIVYLGDPLLTIERDVTVFPPAVTSSTHPDPSITVKGNNANFSWTTPDDFSGIAGYYLKLDQAAATDPAVGGTWATNDSVTLPLDKNGTWYFHLSAVDGAGCVSAPTHFTLQAEVWLETGDDGDDGGGDDGSGDGSGGNIPGFGLSLLVGFVSLAVLVKGWRRRHS